MSNLADLQTINDIDECPSILDVLGFLKFPNINPLSLSEDNTDISSQIDQELGSLSSQQQDTTITDLSSTTEPPTPDTSTFTLSADESKKPELQDETTVPSTFSLIGRGYKSKSSKISSSKKRSTKKRSPSKKRSTKSPSKR